MANIHELDHIKIDDVDDQPGSSTSKPSQLAISNHRSIQASKVNFKLEYYLTLVRSSRGAALVKLVDDFLGSDGVYVFSELLDSPPIKELATHPVDSGHYELIEIFAYETWQTYRERQAHLPKLNENQTRKLKLLSLIHRASHSHIIPYSELLEELEISETQDLEELTIEGIYNNLIKGRLDQKYSRLEVESCMGRDVRLKPIPLNPSHNNPGEDVDMDHNHAHASLTANNVVELHSKLVSWSDCIKKVLNQLDVQIEHIREKDRMKAENDATQTATVESIAQTIFADLSSLSHSNHSHATNRRLKEREDNNNLLSEHSMDIDDHDLMRPSPHKTRKRTRP